MGKEIRRLGLISDTHGLLREEALRTLRGSDLILHAGDVGDPTILERLRELAPVVAVRGNVDTGEWAQALRWVETVEISGTTIYMRHILQDLDLDPLAAGFAMVISGHSHKHGQTLKDGILYINPGSAGPKRFQLPVTVAMLDLLAKPWKTEFLELDT